MENRGKQRARGAVGIEFTIWTGFGLGLTWTHAYARLGVATVYAARFNLRQVLDLWQAAGDALVKKAKGE